MTLSYNERLCYFSKKLISSKLKAKESSIKEIVLLLNPNLNPSVNKIIHALPETVTHSHEIDWEITLYFLFTTLSLIILITVLMRRSK
jgi:hypothetical protein